MKKAPKKQQMKKPFKNQKPKMGAMPSMPMPMEMSSNKGNKAKKRK